jgi:CubicO group peptidase (beta-lactamase class C family)
MAKSITQALVGLAVGDGWLDIHAQAEVPAWRGDARGAITLDQLLRMSSGLAWIEDYSPDHPSDVIEMLFGKGRDDVAAFAEAVPFAHEPGSFFYYSSGTTNIVAHCLARALGVDQPGMEAFMRSRLFGPLGMTSADPRFDAAGTFIGSSY